MPTHGILEGAMETEHGYTIIMPIGRERKIGVSLNYLRHRSTRQGVALVVSSTYKPIDGKRCYDALAVGLTHSSDEAG